jgi:hypothetical protein
MSQQLSIKVADVLQQKFLGLYNGKNYTVLQVVTTPFETILLSV